MDINLEENFFNINFTKNTISNTDLKSGTMSTSNTKVSLANKSREKNLFKELKLKKIY